MEEEGPDNICESTFRYVSFKRDYTSTGQNTF